MSNGQGGPRPASTPRPYVPKAARAPSMAESLARAATAAKAAGATPQQPATQQPATQQTVQPVTQAPPPPSTPMEQDTCTGTDGVALDSRWERVTLPSRFVPYEWQDIHLRHFDIVDQAALARGVRHQNLTLVLDVLAATCTRDPRTLIPPDFRAICLWHKLNDYLNTSSTVTWTSRYGNRCSAKVKRTRVRETALEATRGEYISWMERGFALPTMRDAEVMEDAGHDEDLIFMFQNAEYLDPAPLAAEIEALRAGGDRIPSVTARINELKRRSMASEAKLSILEEIVEFSERFMACGVNEVADVVDTRFDPAKGLEYADYMERMAEVTDDEERRRDLLDEAGEIRRTVEAGAEPHARQEEVPLAFNLWSMFPYT